MSGTAAPESRHPGRFDLWIFFAILGAAFLARAIPIAGDFWLDEIWTYYFSLDLGSAVEVFTRNHHSNNHHLNSIFFHWLGDRSNWASYRIPALLAGTGSVAMAAWLGNRRGHLEALFAAALTAGSFVLIHFSSEARGYSLAVFFALSATWFLDRYLTRPNARSAVAFGVCVSLGFLSQLVFMFYYAGAAAQSGFRLLRRPSGAVAFAWLHALPLACFVALYFSNLRYLQVGRGDPIDAATLVARTVGYSFGLPIVPALAIPYAAFVLFLLAAGLRLLRREGDDSWILMLLAIAVVPFGVLYVLQPEVIALRYFVIAVALLLLLAARLLAELYRARGMRRLVCITALCIFTLGNTVHTLRFFEHGRGDYRGALDYMAERTPGDRIHVGSDHDFRNGLVLRFYKRFLPADKKLIYHRQENRPRGGPEWMLTHRVDRSANPPRRLRDVAGNAYQFERDFGYAAISGFAWTLYRNTRVEQTGARVQLQHERNSPSSEPSQRGESPEAAQPPRPEPLH